MAIHTTGIYTGYVLVHDDKKVIMAQEVDEKETSSIFTIEKFETEKEMLNRIEELKLIPLPIEEEV